MPDRRYDAHDYTVGWVCALPLEMAAAKGMLDEIHPNLSEQASGDHNSYILGQVAGHNVVIACLPLGIYGTTSAATVAKDMLRPFKSIRFGLMVGIGGGAPSPGHDIRLGDIVVSQPSGTTRGVIQYDRGKDGRDGFERTGSLNTPPKLLLAALGRLQADHLMGDCRIPDFLSELFDKHPRMKKAFSFQGGSNDCLFQAEYDHVGDDSGCEQCDRTRAVQRDARGHADPVVHYGNIASGSLVIKNARTRKWLSKELRVLCFEMEAAGLMQDYPCLVIRGICDYADSHKNKAWQGYAATVAAAYAKELLSVISPERVLHDKAIPQLVSDPVLQELLAATNETISKHATKQDTRYENDKQIECHRVFKTSQYEDFKNINPDRVPGTCRWVLEHPQYTKWQQSSHDDLLWISADPGCGKSVLAKALIDEELGNSSDHTVCYFFFKDNEDQNDLATALCAVLHQLFGRLPHLLRHAIASFEKNDHKLQNEVDELWRILLAAATDKSAGPVICVFDALDECQRDGRQKLVRLATDFYTRRVTAPARTFPLKFLVTSRPYQDIESGFGDIPPELPSIRLAGEESNADISEEINLVIRKKVQELRTEQEVRDLLEAKLLATSNRTYLWLHLVWDELQQSRRSRTALMNKIDSLPSTVEQAYESILQRIRPGQREEAQILLHIVVGARRPLTLVEMDVVFQLAVDSPGAIAHEELDLNTDRVKSDIRELCGLFVFISDSRIYLIHQTAKEFLVAREGASDASGEFWKHSLRRESSDQIMTRVCVQYLSFRDIRDDLIHEEMRKDDPDMKDFPLLEYSAVNWPAHFRDMDDADDSLLNLVFTLYDAQTERYKTWLSIFWEAAHPYTPRRGRQPVNLAALTGQIEVVKRLLEEGADVNAQDGYHGNALYAASSKRHAEIVKLLLEKGADVNAQGGYHGNALQAALHEGHFEIVKLLLEEGADVNAQSGEDGRTPLSWAAENGYESAMRLLLSTGNADVNAGDGSGRTALSWAAQNGHESTVRLLLDTNDIDADKADTNGRTPLLWATERGHFGVVKMLVGRGDVNIAVEDACGLTAMQLAALNYHEEVEALLLGSNAPTVEDFYALQTLFGEAMALSSPS